MKDQETVKKFIELRSQGWSFRPHRCRTWRRQKHAHRVEPQVPLRNPQPPSPRLDDLQDTRPRHVESRVAGRAEKARQGGKRIETARPPEVSTAQLYSWPLPSAARSNARPGPSASSFPPTPSPKKNMWKRSRNGNRKLNRALRRPLSRPVIATPANCPRAHGAPTILSLLAKPLTITCASDSGWRKKNHTSLAPIHVSISSIPSRTSADARTPKPPCMRFMGLLPASPNTSPPSGPTATIRRPRQNRAAGFFFKWFH